jgi:hypothetical protein
MLIPQVVVFAFVSIAAWVIAVLAWVAIIFTARYPDSFFRFIYWWLRWWARLTAYFYLLTDKYPIFSGREDPEYPVIFEVETPGELSRLTTFFRFPVFAYPTYMIGDGFESYLQWQWQYGTGFPMTFPHLVVLFFIGIAAAVVLFLSWWAILFIGRYPRSFFDFVVWFFRWGTRVTAYSYYMTDKYPPFSGEA